MVLDEISRNLSVRRSISRIPCVPGLKMCISHGCFSEIVGDTSFEFKGLGHLPPLT